MSLKNHPILTLAALLGFTTTAYTLTPSDNLTKHCNEKELEKFENDENLCFVHQYKDIINKAAKNYQIPPELIGAILYQENDWRMKTQDLADIASNLIGRIHTAGPGQIQTTTARNLDDPTTPINTNIVQEYHSILNQPETAIDYVARELHRLQEQSNLKATSFEGIDLLASQYRTGLQKGPKPNAHGYDVLIILRGEKIQRALEIPTPPHNRQGIQDYLNSTTRIRVE